MTRSPRFLLQGALAYGLDVIDTLPSTALGDPTPWGARSYQNFALGLALLLLAAAVGRTGLGTRPSPA
jgi:hypothetical protein